MRSVSLGRPFLGDGLMSLNVDSDTPEARRVLEVTWLRAKGPVAFIHSAGSAVVEFQRACLMLLRAECVGMVCIQVWGTLLASNGRLPLFTVLSKE